MAKSVLLRESIRNLDIIIDSLCNMHNIPIQNQFFVKSLSFMEILVKCYDDHAYIEKQNIPHKIVVRLLLMNCQIISDLYIKLNYKLMIGTINKNESKQLEIIKKSIDGNYTDLLIKDYNNILNYVNASTESIDLSAYDRIAMLSSLDDDDYDRLLNFNPAFKEEFDHFNIPIDTAFISRQINKWIKSTNEIKTALENTARFICDMNYCDCDKIDYITEELLSLTNEKEEIMQAIADYDIEKIILLIQELYENNKNLTLKK